MELHLDSSRCRIDDNELHALWTILNEEVSYSDEESVVMFPEVSYAEEAKHDEVCEFTTLC